MIFFSLKRKLLAAGTFPKIHQHIYFKVPFSHSLDKLHRKAFLNDNAVQDNIELRSFFMYVHAYVNGKVKGKLLIDLFSA